MKWVLVLVVIMTALSGMAQNKTNKSPVCFNATFEKETASVIGRVELRRNFIKLTYLSANSEVLEVYSGIATRVRRTANGFKVENVFVRDRGTGWIEGLGIEVLKNSVILKQKGGPPRSLRIIGCPGLSDRKKK